MEQTLIEEQLDSKNYRVHSNGKFAETFLNSSVNCIQFITVSSYLQILYNFF